jgi:RNA polymerase sigma-70 factor (ECF subfamily)
LARNEAETRTQLIDPALHARPRGGVMAVVSFEVLDGRIATIRSVVNPDKLGHLGPIESLRDVLEQTR